MIAPEFTAKAGVDYPDNHIRFAVLNQAAIGVARYIFRPDVFHAHDWQAGLLPVYLRENLALDPTFFGVRCIFTIHNLGYQGNFPAVRDRRSGPRPPAVSSRRPGILRPAQFPESRHRLGGCDQYRQPDLRARNPNS